MRITGLHIDRFGVWQNLKMDNLPDGITVFYGPNEAGKSTLMQYMRTVLYGFHPDRCVRFVGGKRSGTLIDGRLGGSLFLAGREREYQITRHANESDPLSDPGELKIATQDGQRFGAQRLATLLNGIDESIFNNIFAVGLREIQHLASLDDTQAARQLYSLSTGTDRVSLVDVTRQLQATRCRLVGCEDRSSLLGEYVAAQTKIQGQIEHLGTQSERWAKLVAESDAIEDEIRRIEQARGTASGKAQVAEVALLVQPKWDEVRRLSKELEALGVVPEVPKRAVEALEAIRSETQLQQEKLADIKRQQDQLAADIEASQPSEALGRYSARIRTTLDQRVMMTTIDDRVRRLRADVEEAEFEIQAEHERLGLMKLSDESGALPKFDAITISKLQEPAYSLERSRETLEAAKKETSDYKAEAKRIHREIAKALGRDEDWFEKNGADDVLNAVEETSGEAAGLRRRVELEKELKQLEVQLEDAESRRAASLRSQLMPWDVVRALGVLFALGSVLIFCGLFGHSFGWSDQRRGLFLLLGTVAAGLGGLLKLSLDVPVREKLRDAVRHIELIKKQIEASRNEMDQIEERLPTRRTGPISLRDTETQLVKLEALMPLENQRRAILKLAAEAEHRAVEVAKSMKHTRDRWEDTLRSLGLSTKLTPEQLKALSGQGGSLPQLHRTVDLRQQELDHAQQEQSAVDNRLRELFADLLIRPIGDRPTEHIEQLTAVLASDAELQQKVESLRSQERQLRREEQSVQRMLDHLERQRDNQISAAGAMDEDDLAKLLTQRARWEQLYAQRKEAQTELNRLLGNHRDDQQVEAELQKGTASDLPNRLQRAREDLQQSDARMKELEYRRGEITEQIRQLSADQTLGQMQLQLGTIQHGIDKGIEKWKVASTISSLLKTVYKKYEKERQPDTLKEASRHLSAMTGGRYPRIWTPLAEDALIVDDRDGKSFPVEFLSRGTREQLFLSLRLSLISCYSRRKVRMPLVLDDVLVNFDRERTEAAASVLVDFARAGNQVFVFTCHEHIKDIFGALQADVRTLPVRVSEQVEPEKAPQPKKEPRRRKRKKRPAVLLGYAPDDSPMFGERVENHLAEWADAYPLPVDPVPVERASEPAELTDENATQFQLAFWEGSDPMPIWDGPPIDESTPGNDDFNDDLGSPFSDPPVGNFDSVKNDGGEVFEASDSTTEYYEPDPFVFQYDSPPVDLPQPKRLRPTDESSAPNVPPVVDNDLWEELHDFDPKGEVSTVQPLPATDELFAPPARIPDSVPAEIVDKTPIQPAVEFDDEGIIETIESSSEIQEISQVFEPHETAESNAPARAAGIVAGLRFHPAEPDPSESDSNEPAQFSLDPPDDELAPFDGVEPRQPTHDLPVDTAAAASIMNSLMPQTLDEEPTDLLGQTPKEFRAEIKTTIQDISQAPELDDIELEGIRTVIPDPPKDAGDRSPSDEIVDPHEELHNTEELIRELDLPEHAQSSKFVSENFADVENSLTDESTPADLDAIAAKGMARHHETLATGDTANQEFEVEQTLENDDETVQQAIEEPPMNSQTPNDMSFADTESTTLENAAVVNLNATEVDQPQYNDEVALEDEVAEDDEYEYVEVDEGEDLEDSDDYEYEYVEVDEDEDGEVAEGEDDEEEYEYVEVGEDDDEEVAEGEEDEYEYEYVEVDEDEEDGEVAEGEEDEYEYVEVDEDDVEEDDEYEDEEVAEGEEGEDDEYEYEYVEDDEDDAEIGEVEDDQADAA